MENIKDNDMEDNLAQKETTPDIIPESVFEAIPEEDRGRMKSIISQTMISGVVKRGNPLSDKITSEHITDLIKNSDAQDKRDRDERKTEKNYQIAFLVIGLLFMVFLIVFLKDSPDLLYKILIALFSFLGGFGMGRFKQKD